MNKCSYFADGQFVSLNFELNEKIIKSKLQDRISSTVCILFRVMVYKLHESGCIYNFTISHPVTLARGLTLDPIL